MNVKNFEYLVNCEAYKYQKVSDLELEDLIQEGMLALYCAANNFDSKKNTDFVQYAKSAIGKAIQRAICSFGNAIRIPENKLNDYFKIMQLVDSDEINYQKISLELKMPVNKIISTIELVENAKSISSLNIKLSDDEDSEETIAFVKDEREGTEEVITEKETSDGIKNTVAGLLNFLTEKELLIIKYRFGLDGEKIKSYSEIAKVFGYSKETIRIIEKEAIIKMRNHISQETLESLLVA